MSERVKLADAEVLSALASTDYLLAERNGAIGRAALGDNTFLTEAQRLWLEYFPKASGANLLKGSDFGDGAADAWDGFTRFTVEEGMLDGVNALSVDLSGIPSSLGRYDLYQNVSPETSTWYTYSIWHRGAALTLYATGMADSSVRGYFDGSSVNVPTDGSRTLPSEDEWTRHVFTFKSLAEWTGNSHMVYIRAFQGTGTAYVCMPKFERGPVATPWGGGN